MAMNRRGHRSASLFPRIPPRSPTRPRICSSAPTQVISVQEEEDWNWDSLHAENDNTGSQQGTPSWVKGVDGDQVDDVVGITKVDIPAMNQEKKRNAGDFTDFIDSGSSDSESSYLDDSDSDGPYEYWTTRKSYSPSPFSNCSSLSFGDSDQDEDSAHSSDYDRKSLADGIDHTMSTILPSTATTGIFRRSDLGPSPKRSWTALAYGVATFTGPTSI